MKKGRDAQTHRRTLAGTAAAPPAHTVPLQKEGGRAPGDEKTDDIKRSDVKGESGNSAKTAQHRLSWKSDSRSVSDRKASLQSAHKEQREEERKREAGVLAALLQADRWGCWIRDCVKRNTTQKNSTVPCSKATCTAIRCLQRNKG